MGKVIALLADGSNSDLYACFCAVKLARKMEGKLLSVLLMSDKNENPAQESSERWQACSPSEFLYLISSLGNFEGKVPCIIMGTQDQEDFDKKQKWLSQLVQKIYTNRRWYLGDLTVFLAKPWSEKDFKKVLKQLRSDCSLYPIEMVFA